MTERHDTAVRESYARDTRARPDDELGLDGELETPRVDTAKERSCLRCSQTFLSAWAGERVCPRCKSTAAWRAGTPVGTHPSSKR